MAPLLHHALGGWKVTLPPGWTVEVPLCSLTGGNRTGLNEPTELPTISVQWFNQTNCSVLGAS